MSKNRKMESPNGNIYATVLIMAEHQRQKPEEWKEEVLPLKTGQEISLYCHRNWVWDGLEPHNEWYMRQVAKEEAEGKRKYRNRR